MDPAWKHLEAIARTAEYLPTSEICQNTAFDGTWDGTQLRFHNAYRQGIRAHKLFGMLGLQVYDVLFYLCMMHDTMGLQFVDRVLITNGPVILLHLNHCIPDLTPQCASGKYLRLDLQRLNEYLHPPKSTPKALLSWTEWIKCCTAVLAVLFMLFK